MNIFIIIVILKFMLAIFTGSLGQLFDYENHYHNWTDIEHELQRVAQRHSGMVTLLSLGKTFEKRDIKAVIVTNTTDHILRDKLVVFECGIHAREWISVSFCLWTINRLLYDRPLLENFQFLIIPVLNPDGYEILFTLFPSLKAQVLISRQR